MATTTPPSREGLARTTSATDSPQPGETEKERLDRELGEMLEELRVALPGVQLLLGFLLVLPFSPGFEDLASYQRDVYLACFLLTAAVVALFIAPTAAHRLGFRKVDKLLLLVRTNRQIVGGLAMLAVAIALATFLVCSVVLASRWATVTATLVALWFGVWWFVVPRSARRRTERSVHSP